MKKIISVLLFLFVAIVTFGQDEKEYYYQIEGVKVIAPKFKGPKLLVNNGNLRETSLRQYLTNNIQYPEEAKMWDKEGIEVVHFTVTSKGDIADINIINSVSPEVDKEVVRVLETTGKMWSPGLKNGELVDMEREVSIVFCLNGKVKGSKDFLSMAKPNFDRANKKFFVAKDNKSALRCYNKAIRCYPNDKSMLLARGMCRYELGDNEGAFKDWNRIRTLGGVESDEFLKSFVSFKGYNEMINLLARK
jgi:TonB family C-terminal domain